MGIDAAWTEKEPSGVALVCDKGSGWQLNAVATSYAEFLGYSDAKTLLRHRGSIPEPDALLAAGEKLAGVAVDLVAIDMPLAITPIVQRRTSDNMISSAYGARHASTHTPSPSRPGRISDDLRMGFAALGYPLATTEMKGCALVEVYPHPALIELARAERRLPYKHSKIHNYWPEDSPGIRRRKLFEVWEGIVHLLDGRILGVKHELRLPSLDARGYEMKAFEDALDAVVCAWVGTCVLDGKATAYGNEISAIWVPRAI